MSEILKKAYSAELFREQGYELIDLLANYLDQVRAPKAVINAIDFKLPEVALERWAKDFAQAPNADVLSLFSAALEDSVKLLAPKYMGHQIGPPVPVSTLAGLFGDFVNNGMGIYEMGMAGTAVERVLIKVVARQFGFSEEADGFLTSGGTLANLTALLAARSLKANNSVWENGQKRQLVLMVSEAAHYCVDRAVRIMGWGAQGIIKVPIDESYRMRTELLDEYYQEAVAAGKEVIAVVGSACTTATGSFDDLRTIAQFCQQKGVWFHVDGAHGAALAFSKKYARILDGIAQADSVAMDFHKMLLTPSVTTALVFRKGTDSYHTFSQEAQYLFNREEPEWFNLAKRTFECTKLMIGFKAYSIIRTYGTEIFDEYVTLVCDLGQALANKVLARENFKLAIMPSCNIICFRYADANLENQQINDLNERIRQQLLADGAFYIVQTRLAGSLWLRCTLTNPFTTEADLDSLLDQITSLASAGVAS